MEAKEIELRKLGFQYNDHQECYTLSINGFVYYVDKWDMEDMNIDSIKKNIEKDRKWRSSSDEFKEGEISAKKEFKKKLRDIYNKYNSWLKEETKNKLTKTTNQNKVLEYQAKLDLLKELMNGNQ